MGAWKTVGTVAKAAAWVVGGVVVVGSLAAAAVGALGWVGLIEEGQLPVGVPPFMKLAELAAATDAASVAQLRAAAQAAIAGQAAGNNAGMDAFAGMGLDPVVLAAGSAALPAATPAPPAVPGTPAPAGTVANAAPASSAS